MLDVGRLRVLSAVARTGSVTGAARDLHITQPAVSHHLSRLEAETGAVLVQRVGRGVRLTPAGELLAKRAAEILARVESAAAELSSVSGLSAGRVQLAAFGSAMSSLVPQAARALFSAYPGLELGLTETHPEEALRLLRTAEVDVALIFRYADTAPEDPDIRLTHLLDDPIYLLTTEGGTTLADHRDSRWIGGCDRCRLHLKELCHRAGFDPKIAFHSEDLIVLQSLVAAGLGVTTIPGLALRAHHDPAVTATRIVEAPRRTFVATYGQPPYPPATNALVDALTAAAAEVIG